MNLNLVCEPKSLRKKKRGRGRRKNVDHLKKKVQEKRRKLEDVPEKPDEDDEDGNDDGVRSVKTVRNKETSSKDGTVWST